MKIILKERIVIYSVIIFLIFSFVFPHSIIIIDFARQGDRPSERYENFIDIIFAVANWPSLLLRICPVNAFAHFGIASIIINGIGWGLVGFIIGLFAAGIRNLKKRKRSGTVSP